MPLVKRLIKGSTLTYQEMDDNLSYLDNKVSGSSGYITRFSGSTALTSSLLNQISSTVFVYGSFNVSQSLTVNNSSVVTLASPSYYIATGSVTASINVQNKLFSLTSASVNFGEINTSTSNTSFGQETLWSGSNSTGNTSFGYNTLKSNTTGNYNTSVGFSALLSNTNGPANTGVGGYSLYYNTSGQANTALGTFALGANTVGNSNVALGYEAGVSNVTGSSNVFLGYNAGYSETNSNRLYIANSDTTSPLIKGNFSTGLLQLNTAAGTQITGSLNVSGSTIISGSLTQGLTTIASGQLSHAQGQSTIASGSYSHAEGRFTSASGNYSHAEGTGTISSGQSSHAEGQATIASGSFSHAEGYFTIASGSYSHAEGVSTTAQGEYSHAEGYATIALGLASHTEGYLTITSGSFSHAEGISTTASGDYSHAEGNNTVASGLYQHVQGAYNISSSNSSAFILGNGTSNANRSNLIYASGSQVQITGSLITTGEINASGFRGSITISPNYRYISLQDPTDPFGNLVALYLSGSGIVSKRLPYLQLGDLGLNINDQVNILSTGVKITGSLDVSTSASRFVLAPSTKDLSWIDSTDNMNQFSIYLSGSNDNRQVLLQSGDKGFNLDDKLKVVSTGTQITGSLIVSGSGATFYNIITLPALSTLPSGSPTGSFAVSGSNANCKPYFYNGSTWTALF